MKGFSFQGSPSARDFAGARRKDRTVPILDVPVCAVPEPQQRTGPFPSLAWSGLGLRECLFFAAFDFWVGLKGN